MGTSARNYLVGSAYQIFQNGQVLCRICPLPRPRQRRSPGSPGRCPTGPPPCPQLQGRGCGDRDPGLRPSATPSTSPTSTSSTSRSARTSPPPTAPLLQPIWSSVRLTPRPTLSTSPPPDTDTPDSDTPQLLWPHPSPQLSPPSSTLAMR